jgi:hypothetical protein
MANPQMLLLAGTQKFFGLLLKAFASVADGWRACILGKDGRFTPNFPASSRRMLSWLPLSKYLAGGAA